MRKAQTTLARLLDILEGFYGPPKRPGPSDPYEMILYTNCGYPASDVACTKGFKALKKEIGLRPDKILAAPIAKLTAIMRLGGIIPELRAARLKAIAARVNTEFDGTLKGALKRPLAEAKKALKKFPTIGDPGAEKILLFTNTAAIAAVPSNAVHVPLRLGFGREQKNYAAAYKSAQAAIRAELPQDVRALQRAYLLLKRHGHELCKRSSPRCEICPLSPECAYYSRRSTRGS